MTGLRDRGEGGEGKKGQVRSIGVDTVVSGSTTQVTVGTTDIE